MKILIKFFIVFTLLFGVFFQADAIKIGDLFSVGNKGEINICKGGNCDLQGGIDKVKETLDGDIETERSFSEYIVDVVLYILTFVSLIAVLYIIYAGFMILTGAGDEEKIKSSKKTILYVVIGMIIIWFAYGITDFVINALQG